MSDEPARPEELPAAGGDEAPPEADQPNEPVEPTNGQEPEMATVPIEQTDTVPEEKKPEAEEGEKAVAPDQPAQEVAQKESSVKIATKPTDSKSEFPLASKSEFPLADSNILAELKAGETRAREAAKAIQALKEQLAASTKKDLITEEDIKNMEQKQKELMDKMQEFEDITKKIQQLVGLVDVPSSQLGIPKELLVPAVGGDKLKDSPNQLKGQPTDTLPKVIICGTSDIDEVPKIIVCEPTSVRNGKHLLYHQIKNDDVNGKAASKGKITDQGPSDQGQSRIPSPPNSQFTYPGYSGYPGGQGNMETVRPFGDGSHNMRMGQGGIMQPGMGQCGMPCPGMGQGGMTQPGMGQCGMPCPGMGQGGMMQPGMGQCGMPCPGMGQGGMMQPSFGPQGIMQPGMGPPGMMQPGMGQPGMMQPGLMQPWLAQPGMMQYLAMQPGGPQLFGMAQPGVPQGRGIEKPRLCNPCGHPRKNKSQKTDSTRSGLKESGQKTSRSKTDEDDTKKRCRKRKQCICQVSGLCTWNTNKPPFPTM